MDLSRVQEQDRFWSRESSRMREWESPLIGLVIRARKQPDYKDDRIATTLPRVLDPEAGEQGKKAFGMLEKPTKAP